jgi:hypothetical protein
MPDVKILYEGFIYSTGPIALAAAAGAAAAANINIAADADFQANYITVTVAQANALIVNFDGTIIINDSAGGRTWSNVNIPIESIRGTGQLPYPINPPKLIRRNTTLVVNCVNSAAGVATVIHVSLHGNKLREVA